MKGDGGMGQGRGGRYRIRRGWCGGWLARSKRSQAVLVGEEKTGRR